jgi:hypothetical protein
VSDVAARLTTHAAAVDVFARGGRGLPPLVTLAIISAATVWLTTVLDCLLASFQVGRAEQLSTLFAFVGIFRSWAAALAEQRRTRRPSVWALGTPRPKS